MALQYLRLGILALACAASFWLGYRVCSGGYEKRIADIAVAISGAQNAAADRTRKQLEAATARSAAAKRERQEALSRLSEAERALANTPDSGSRFSDDELRALGEVHRALFARPPSGVPAAVSGAPGAVQPAEGLRVGASEVGLSVQGLTQ